MMRLGLLFSHSVPKRLPHRGACRLCCLTASRGSGLLGDIIIPRAEPRGRQSRWLSLTARKLGEGSKKAGRAKSLTPLLFINNYFLLKRKIPLAPDGLYWAVEKATDHRWETCRVENKHQFQVFLCNRGRAQCVFLGDAVDERQTRFCHILWGTQGCCGHRR